MELGTGAFPEMSTDDYTYISPGFACG